MTTKQSFNWVRYIEKAILDLDDIPLMGEIPAFDFEGLQNSLRKLFDIPSLKLKPLKWNWYSSETLHEDLGEDVLCHNVAVLPLQGKVALLIRALDVNSLVIWLTEKKAGFKSVLNSQFIKGLMAYSSVEVLNLLQSTPFFSGFLLRFLSEGDLPSCRALGLDIHMEAFGETVSMRLIVPETFRKNWIEHFLQRPQSLSRPNQEKILLDLSLEAGRTHFTMQEWKQVQVGDFIRIDNCHVDPDTKTGSLHLNLGNKTLFRVRIKGDKFKILEQQIYEESFMSEDLDNFSDDVMNEEVDHFDEKDAALNDELETPVQVQEEKLSFEQIDQVPLQVAVELTRFKMTCAKLMQLRPGNLLELNIQPEKPVHLVANGKKIAEGEIIRVGETLGVRILNMN